MSETPPAIIRTAPFRTIRIRAHTGSSSWPPNAPGNCRGGIARAATSSKKSTVIAMEEARRGLVKYDIQPDAIMVEDIPGIDQI